MNDINALIEKVARSKRTTLSFSRRGLKCLPPEIGQLTQLKRLNLSYCDLTTLPAEIGHLTGLISIKLNGNNNFESLPAEIGLLANLQVLELDYTCVATLPSEIRNLGKLRELTLYLNSRDDKRFTLPAEIGHLVSLEKLKICWRGLSSLPKEIGNLVNLAHLDLSMNELEAIPSEIGRLANLRDINLSCNRISLLPPELGRLSKLQVLNLGRNKLATLPSEIGALDGLERLTLSLNNQITRLPAEIGNLAALTALNLVGVSLSYPPSEIVDQGTSAIIAFLRAQLESTKKQWVAKLVVVGEGGVGKTSLLRRLRGEPFVLGEATTHGIEGRVLGLPHPSHDGVSMELSAWDFGGQEIYHATHQFFLTDGALFLLAWNARLGHQQGRLTYWLDTIRARAPRSPVLIIATHTDEREAHLPLADLRARYPQIVGHCAISNATGAGIDGLRAQIQATAATLPLMGESWPTRWLDATEAISRRPENYATVGQALAILAEHGVDEDKAGVLLQWLHERGVVVHFREDPELNDIVLLSPHWVSQVIGRVLDSPEVARANGLLTRQHIRELWHDIEPVMRDHLLRLMERFDLSYHTDQDRHTSLVVERLPLAAPPYQTAWNGVKEGRPWREMARTYRMPALPAGIPGWFIAREHRFSIGLHWRHGVLLADGPERRHLALVEALPDKHCVRLRVRGPHPQNFFALLKDGLEATLARYPGLDVQRTIPCPGHDGVSCPHEFNEETLLKFTERTPPRTTAQCPESGEDVSIGLLLHGWEDSRQETPAVTEELRQLRALNEQLRAQAQQRLADDQARHEQILREIKESREAIQRELRQDDLAAVLAGQTELLRVLAGQVAAGQTELRDQLQALRDQAQASAGLMQREFTNIFRREQSKIESRCPGVFLLRPVGSRGWLQDMLGQKMELQLLCERPGGWHPSREGGRYEITQPAQWLTRLAPYLQRLCKILKHTAPVIGVVLADEWGEQVEAFEDAVERMEELVKHLPVEKAPGHGHGEMERAEGSTLRALRHLLDNLDPARVWGGLRNVLTPEQHYLWLCEEHAAEVRR